MSDTDLSPTQVSIVVPTHRRALELERLLDSLHSQTYPHAALEVLVVPSPDDPGAAVVDSFARRTDLKVVCQQLPCDPTRGRSASAKRNHGAQLASGAWLAFIDDDCVASPGWISAAAVWFQPGVAAIEGQTDIPPPAEPTLTWRGLRQLARRGGYQTCNMFYRRDRFLEAGGFDPAFPFYLEDTDLAWTVLDRGGRIEYASDAVVSHPTPAAAPSRLLDDARRVVLLPYLFSKHPARYRADGRRALRWSHWVYLVVYALLLSTVVAGRSDVALPVTLVLLGLIVCHVVRLFRGCRVTVHELVVTTALLPIVPLVRFAQLIRGNLRHRVWLWR